jgi:hypothetical protein
MSYYQREFKVFDLIICRHSDYLNRRGNIAHIEKRNSRIVSYTLNLDDPEEQVIVNPNQVWARASADEYFQKKTIMKTLAISLVMTTTMMMMR